MRSAIKRVLEKTSENFQTKEERTALKKEIDALLANNPPRTGGLKGRYKGLYSHHLRYKIVVVYKIFSNSVLVLAVEPREGSYKKEYE